MATEGVGKTSLLKQAIMGMENQAECFYTEEIRNRGKRKGLRIITLKAEEAILATTGIASN